MEPSNEYLNEVMEHQARVDQELKRPRWEAAAAPAAAPAASRGAGRVLSKALHEFQATVAPVASTDYRITGFWFWQTVVVAPNVYVVHTRRGRPAPVHIGLGISFRFNPYADAFLVIPAAVQTLIINARCICAERQGVLVQAYVQWIIDDIATAYRKLDFSDPEDPMRIVNVQLREQAEAAIKDKVATMGIDAVLSDKQPVIEELTHRLRAVAEGNREGDRSSGLGLKIVTVQIKEAVVSSTQVWQNLQKPFRAERAKTARMAELEAEQQIARQELVNRQGRATAELEAERQLAQLRAVQEAERYDREQAEKARRHQVEQTAEQQAVAERTATERVRHEADLGLALHQLELQNRRTVAELEALRRQIELERARAEQQKLQTAAQIERTNLAHQAQSTRAERDLTLFKLRRETENDLSDRHVQTQLIARLPEIAAALPKPQELRAVSIGADQAGTATSLVGFLAAVLQLAENALTRPAPPNGVQS